jgi:hypothetical protein
MKTIHFCSDYFIILITSKLHCHKPDNNLNFHCHESIKPHQEMDILDT